MEILTAGHSGHPYETFLGILREGGVTAVADVRSSPSSRRFPWHDGAAMRTALARDGIAYAFLGTELGGRPADPALYAGGVADYEAMARTASFRAGIARVARGSESHRIALVCSEAEPADCHRCLLVGRALREGGFAVAHLLAGGRRVSQAGIEERLMDEAGLGGGLFRSGGDLGLAYARRAARFAYRR